MQRNGPLKLRPCHVTLVGGGTSKTPLPQPHVRVLGESGSWTAQLGKHLAASPGPQLGALSGQNCPDERDSQSNRRSGCVGAKNLAIVARWLWINKKPVRGTCHAGHTQVPAHFHMQVPAHFHSQARNVCCEKPLPQPHVRVLACLPLWPIRLRPCYCRWNFKLHNVVTLLSVLSTTQNVLVSFPDVHNCYAIEFLES
jgi:hypothetical protein